MQEQFLIYTMFTLALQKEKCYNEFAVGPLVELVNTFPSQGKE